MIKRSIIALFVALSITPISTAASHIIPFRLVKNLIVFQATVEGRTGNFILDTGASDLILNRTYFEGNADPIAGGQFQSIHGATPSNRGDHVQLHLDGLSIRNYAVVLDLSPIEKRKGFQILGLAGIRCFQQYELTVDFFSQQIILYDLDRKGNRISQAPLPLPTETLTFRYKQHLPYVTARIDQTELQLGLDTGVETNVLSTRILAGLRGQIDGLESKTVMGVNGQTSHAPSGRVENIRIGTLPLPAMQTIFLSVDPLNQLPGPELDGLLGQEFLQHFRTAINFKKKEIYLWDKEAINQESLAIGKY